MGIDFELKKLKNLMLALPWLFIGPLQSQRSHRIATANKIAKRWPIFDELTKFFAATLAGAVSFGDQNDSNRQSADDLMVEHSGELFQAPP